MLVVDRRWSLGPSSCREVRVMGRISARWRRFWGVRPGVLRRPVTLLGQRRTMGEPRGGPHGRGWSSRHTVLKRPEETEEREAGPPG
jgi:hypothetical protein